MIRVALRLDDPSQTSHHGVERGILAALEKAGLRATFAVIPFRESGGRVAPFDPAAAAHLIEARAAGVLEVALHGYTHTEHRSAGAGGPSEFLGVPGARQNDWIRRGRDALEALFEVGIDGFVPPWNRLDATTVGILEGAGFGYLSGDWRTPMSAGDLRVLPRTCQLKQVREAVREARRFAAWSPVVVALMHHYDFIEAGQAGAPLDMARLAELLGWLSAQPDVEVLPLRELAGRVPVARCNRALRCRAWQERRHWRIAARMPRHALVPAPCWWLLARGVGPAGV